MTNPFALLKPKTSTHLEAGAGFDEADHLWEQNQIDGLTAAYAARRPLLVRGEAGSGKSQMARAAAYVLGGPKSQPLSEVIHPRFEALDLLYRFDAVRRLADATAKKLKPDTAYLDKGALWLALEACRKDLPRPVLLIDEIDKADADVPNSLLDVLGNRGFRVPITNQQIKPDGMPLIIITTNEERELPPAFVRRCLVLNLNPPAEEAPFIDWLLEHGKVHARYTIRPDLRAEAARQVWSDRQAAQAAGHARVGLAEYIDLLAALHDLTQDLPSAKRHAEQKRWLTRLADYFLVKGADATQGQHART
jgi:MoxR-like ATPase